LISIHGRTLKQLYTGDADFEFIDQVRASVSCPVMANGGITSYTQAKEIGQKRGFDGIMI
jgi:tRNA-dihydrouridine synthase